MRQIRQLTDEAQFLDYARICVNAYPGEKAEAETMAKRFRETAENNPTVSQWGVYEDATMIGGMFLLDLEMNYFGRFVPAGGVGMVAVDQLQRKRGAAKDIVHFFLDRCVERGQSVALLYPFRPDFYHRMGFGHGAKMDQYSFTPASVPASPSTGGLTYLGPDDLDRLEACYARAAARQHGYCRRSRWQMSRLAKRVGEARTLVGYTAGGELRGYLAFDYRKGSERNFLKNDLVIREWVWDGPETLMALCSFLNSLADQVNRVVYATQQRDFHYLLKDARNGTDNLFPFVTHETNLSGVGLMYRVVSFDGMVQAMAERDFNGVTAAVDLELTDTFRPANAGSHRLVFEGGRLRAGANGSAKGAATKAPSTNAATPKGGGAIPMSIDVADLSSLLMGAVDVATLHRFGRIGVPAASVGLLTKLFTTTETPECLTSF